MNIAYGPEEARLFQSDFPYVMCMLHWVIMAVDIVYGPVKALLQLDFPNVMCMLHWAIMAVDIAYGE